MLVMGEASTRMNDKLNSLYESHWGDLECIGLAHDSLSAPLLLKVPREYQMASSRLLVVGQQTNGWDGHGEKAELGPVRWLMNGYEHFALGRRYKGTPFWQASYELYGLLNPNCPPGGFMWSNLIKVDQDGNRPSHEVEEAICSLQILPKEIEILQPDVVVFFSGPRYDTRLCSTFSSLRFVPTTDCFDRLEHRELPFHTYRTKHPKYLRLAGMWHTIAKIAEGVDRHRPDSRRDTMAV